MQNPIKRVGDGLKNDDIVRKIVRQDPFVATLKIEKMLN